MYTRMYNITDCDACQVTGPEHSCSCARVMRAMTVHLHVCTGLSHHDLLSQQQQWLPAGTAAFVLPTAAAAAGWGAEYDGFAGAICAPAPEAAAPAGKQLQQHICEHLGLEAYFAGGHSTVQKCQRDLKNIQSLAKTSKGHLSILQGAGVFSCSQCSRDTWGKLEGKRGQSHMVASSLTFAEAVLQPPLHAPQRQQQQQQDATAPVASQPAAQVTPPAMSSSCYNQTLLDAVSDEFACTNGCICSAVEFEAGFRQVRTLKVRTRFVHYKRVLKKGKVDEYLWHKPAGVNVGKLKPGHARSSAKTFFNSDIHAIMDAIHCIEQACTVAYRLQEHSSARLVTLLQAEQQAGIDWQLVDATLQQLKQLLPAKHSRKHRKATLTQQERQQALEALNRRML